MNIPIFGITDGDLDKVVEKAFVNENSTIVEVQSGYDDIVGGHVYKELFNEEVILKIPYGFNEKSREDVLKEFKEEIFNKIKEEVSAFKIK